MTAQSGRNLLLKVHNSLTDTFETVGGLRARSLGLVQEALNVTHGDSTGRWRELLGAAGLRHGKISGAGLFRDEASDARVRALFFDGAVTQWQVAVPDFGTIEGPFLVTTLDYSGRHDEAITFQMTLESAGVLTFAEAA